MNYSDELHTPKERTAMEKIKQIGKQELKDLRVEIEKALESLGKSRGVEIKVGNGTYCGNLGTLKLEITLEGEDKYAATFKQVARGMGLDPGMVGRVVDWNGKKATFRGYMNTGRRMPFVFEKEGGRLFTTTEESACKVLGVRMVSPRYTAPAIGGGL